MKKLIAILLAAMLIMGCAACKSNDVDTVVSSEASSETVSRGETTVAGFYVNKYFDTDIWQAVPMISQELIDAGYENYEGCQAAIYVYLDPIDGKLGYYCTDIGSIFRTTDGGKSWEPCSIGYGAGGASSVAVDPNNVNRAVMVGANTGQTFKSNGLYMTTDAGLTWSAKYTGNTSGFKGALSNKNTEVPVHYDCRVQIAYDETTFDESIGGSRVVYWSRENCTNIGSQNHPAIYKSEDGGETWNELSGTNDMAGGHIAVHPKDGRVIAGNMRGCFVSEDGGKTWNKTSDLAMTTLITVRTEPDKAWALTNDGVYISTDFGATFTKVTEQAFPSNTKYAVRLRVSPANPDNMVYLWKGNQGDYQYQTYFSRDGGKTFKASTLNKQGSWIPMTAWIGMFWFSPVDENYMIANEYVSNDGGENFYVSRKGFNAILCGGKFSININDDRYMSLGSQDYNGGFSTDNGKTWTYVNWSGYNWGGFTYGAYTLNDKISVTSDSQGWGQTGELVWTKDGGKTIIRTGLAVNGTRIGYGAVGKENIAFLGEWRTDDWCETWTKMTGCTGVFEHDPETGRLFGYDSATYNVVYSDDDGLSWNKLTISGAKVDDIAYDFTNKILYIVADGYIHDIDMNNPKEVLLKSSTVSGSGFSSLCLDPENTRIMYAVRNGDTERSLDAGVTWTQLCRRVGDGRDNCPDGGHGVCIDFSPTAREVYIAGQCRGVWKIKAVPADSTN